MAEGLLHTKVDPRTLHQCGRDETVFFIDPVSKRCFYNRDQVVEIHPETLKPFDHPETVAHLAKLAAPQPEPVKVETTASSTPVPSINPARVK